MALGEFGTRPITLRLKNLCDQGRDRTFLLRFATIGHVAKLVVNIKQYVVLYS